MVKLWRLLMSIIDNKGKLFGKINITYLFGKKGVMVYTVISLVFIFLGTMMSSDLVWELTDFANYLMVLPNIVGLVAGTAMVKQLLKEGTK